MLHHFSILHSHKQCKRIFKSAYPSISGQYLAIIFARKTDTVSYNCFNPLFSDYQWLVSHYQWLVSLRSSCCTSLGLWSCLYIRVPGRGTYSSMVQTTINFPLDYCNSPQTGLLASTLAPLNFNLNTVEFPCGMIEGCRYEVIKWLPIPILVGCQNGVI